MSEEFKVYWDKDLDKLKEIPEQLKQLKFCRIKYKRKNPFEKDWTNKPYSYKEINKFKDENYGVICGYENLAVIDVEVGNENVVAAIEDNLPETFVVKSGNGGYHFYYFVEDLNKKIILKKNNKHFGEVQSKGQMVAGPNSTHPNGNKYTIEHNVEIASITKEQLMLTIGDFIEKEKIKDEKLKNKNPGKLTLEIAKDIKFSDLLKSYGLKEKSGNYNCPFHESEGEMCLSVDDERGIFNCFDCGKTGNMFYFVSELESITIKEAINKLKNMTNKQKRTEETDKVLTKEEIDILFKENGLKNYFLKIKTILKKFMDFQREEDYTLISLWIVGTYLHKQFSTYPYLYFNAMKGSGKTRMLKIISNLANNGKLVGSMTEAVLFRTASQRTLCIDELEPAAKGRENLQLLLNSGYKKGLTVDRMTKKKTAEGEEQQVETFEVYCPIALANIWGMDNTLLDRCISLILEKSNKSKITKLIETFESDKSFIEIRDELTKIANSIKKTNLFGDVFQEWNNYQLNVVNEVSIVNKVNEVNIVNINNNEEDAGKTHKTLRHYDIYDIYHTFQTLFSSINATNLNGRDLELFFPVFILADICGVLDEIIFLSKEIVKERQLQDREENRDVKLIEFIAQSSYTNFITVEKVVLDFIDFVGVEEKWINSRGISRALKRIGLVLDRRSTGKKREIKINVEKALEKLLMFKELGGV